MPLENHHAIIIGVGYYLHQGFSNLPATIMDAKAIADMLTSPSCGYPAENVDLIVGKKANRESIWDAINKVTQKTDQDSAVFFYFSGHGGRIESSGGWINYLFPRESDLDNLSGTAILGEVFSQSIAGIKASKVVIILDSCHSGGVVNLKAPGGNPWKTGLSEDYYATISQGSGRVVIASSRSDQVSNISPKYALSLFTYHLVQALGGKAAVRNDGYVRVLDVFHSVNEDVQYDEPEQTPILMAKDLDMNFPLALAKGVKREGKRPSLSPVFELREAVIANPAKGAAYLGTHLAKNPEWLAKRDEIDLKRAELERIQHDLELFGPNENDQAARNRIVYFLLRTCLWLEEQQ